ncbi:MAG: helix-turn-helix transcriptional regulator [Clostridia bacterium]|nr:helix-turn-helix transcriptional regulator [Clostridia bacterium]
MINLGNKIRELRKNRGITQEQLAGALGISPQAVSKWEMGAGCPDIGLIPVIAGYFKVSLDVLFDYDASRIEEEIEGYLTRAGRYFWDNFEQAEAIYLEGLAAYPASDELKVNLLSLYECHIRTYGRRELRDRAIVIGERLISESGDYFTVSSAKADLASIYLMEGSYDTAKKLIDSMPVLWPLNINDRMRCSAYMLKGNDRLSSARDWKPYAHQDLFICCDLEGKGYYEIGEYEMALRSFGESVRAIESFLKDGVVSPEAYLIPGTESNHAATVVEMAACYYRLGRIEDCERALERAYSIAVESHGKEYFEANRDICLQAYREAYRETGLEEFRACV